jgi:hypothetical protein
LGHFSLCYAPGTLRSEEVIGQTTAWVAGVTTLSSSGPIGERTADRPNLQMRPIKAMKDQRKKPLEVVPGAWVLI